MKKRTVAIAVDLFEISDFLSWAREQAGIPFRAKLHHQNKWTASRKAVAFFDRFPKEIPDKKKQEAVRKRKDGTKEPVKLQLMILHRDFPLLEMHIRLRWPTIKVGSVRKKKSARPIGSSMKAVLNS